MIIGEKANTPKPTFTIGKMNLKYTDSYKYLGETINSKNNLDDQIKDIKGKTEGAYQTILTVAQDRTFKEIELETIWKLVETSIQAIILYACETWNTRLKDIKELNKIQESIIKRILMTPITTPTEALYTETGLLDIEHLMFIRRINMYYRLKDNPSDVLDMIHKDREISWKTETESLMRKLDIDQTILDEQKENRKRIIKEKVKEHFKNKVKNISESKSKMKYLLQNEEPKVAERKQYIQKLTRTQASIIFRTRTRMLEMKNNYRNKYNNMNCRLCGLEEETQQHVLTRCRNNNIDESHKISMNDIFQNQDMKALATTANTIIRAIKALEDAPP